MKSMSSTVTVKTDQRGMASIFITMIMMLVISLIVIGFSQVARRNQREALDRQLSTQAYYAAESGINVATKFFSSDPTAQIDTLTGGDCTDSSGSAPRAPIKLSPDGNVATTCLMVNSTPASLVVSPLSQSSNIVWHVQNNDNKAISAFGFTWNGDSNTLFTGNNDTCADAKFPAYTDWNCAFGILRVDLVDVGTAADQAALQSNTNVTTLYLIPRYDSAGKSSGILPPMSPSSKAQEFMVKCSKNAECSTTLKFPGNGVSSEYYARLTMLYQDSGSVVLTAAENGRAVGGVKFKDGQAVIDSTGKAQDQLRRIQARIPLIKQVGNLPIFGLQTTDSICKQLNVAPNIYNNTGSCNLN